LQKTEEISDLLIIYWIYTIFLSILSEEFVNFFNKIEIIQGFLTIHCKFDQENRSISESQSYNQKQSSESRLFSENQDVFFSMDVRKNLILSQISS